MALFDLTHKTALLTGAGGHLGKAMAKALVAQGAQVYVAGRTLSKLEVLAAECAASGQGSVVPLVLDVMDHDSIARAITQLNALDIVINNAYGALPANAEKTTEAVYRYAYETTVTAAAQLVEHALPLLKASGSASVINIASMYGMVSPDPKAYIEFPQFHNPPFYGPAKAALLQWTRYMAVHLAPHNIRVNAISPGPFPADAIAQNQPGFLDELSKRVPLGRTGTPNELQGAVVFLASDAASFVTGINIPVDGGWTAW